MLAGLPVILRPHLQLSPVELCPSLRAAGLAASEVFFLAGGGGVWPSASLLPGCLSFALHRDY